MRRSFRWILWIVGVVGIVFVHFLSAFFLPTPWRSINVIMAAVLLLLVFTGRGSAVWFAFAAHGVLELYATTPFGIQIFASAISTLTAVWALQEVLTNRSWYAVGILALGTLALYRGIMTLLLFFLRSQDQPFPTWRFFTAAYGWELLLTATFVMAIYALAVSRSARSVR